MSKLGIAKLVISYAVGSSTAFTVRNVIANNVAPETTQEQMKLVLGSVVVGSMVAAQARTYVDNTVEMIDQFWQEHQAKKQDAVAEEVIS